MALPDKTLSRRATLVRNGLLLVVAASVLMWKALWLGQSVLMAALTVACLFTVYGLVCLVIRYMDLK